MPPKRYLVDGWITFSLSAASATETFTVEHGWNPELSATFWFTMVSTRPLLGSTTTTDPLYWPSESTAGRRTLPLKVTTGMTNKLNTMPVNFSIALKDLPLGEYDCQVSVLDPAGQKVAFWRAPVKPAPRSPQP